MSLLLFALLVNWPTVVVPQTVVWVSSSPWPANQLHQACVVPYDQGWWRGQPMTFDRHGTQSLFAPGRKGLIPLNSTLDRLRDGSVLPLFQITSKPDEPMDTRLVNSDLMLWWGTPQDHCRNWTSTSIQDWGGMASYFATTLELDYLNHCSAIAYVLCIKLNK